MHQRILAVGHDVCQNEIAHLVRSRAVDDAVIDTDEVVAGGTFIIIGEAEESGGSEEPESFRVTELHLVVILGVLLDGEDIDIGGVAAVSYELVILDLVSNRSESEGGYFDETIFVYLKEILPVVKAPEVADLCVGDCRDLVYIEPFPLSIVRVHGEVDILHELVFLTLQGADK